VLQICTVFFHCTRKERPVSAVCNQSYS